LVLRKEVLIVQQQLVEVPSQEVDVETASYNLNVGGKEADDVMNFWKCLSAPDKAVALGCILGNHTNYRF